MRTPRLLILALVAALFVPTMLMPTMFMPNMSFAKDAASEEDKEDKTPITVPSFSVESIAPEGDDLLEGWKVLDDDAPAGQPSEDTVGPIVESVGLTEDDIYIHPLMIKTPAGTQAAAVMIDNDAKEPSKFNAALKAKATEAGWVVRELGTPERLVVVGGEATVRDQVLEELVAHVVYQFSDLARDRLNIQKKWDKSETDRANRQSKGFIMAGRKLVPNAGTLTAIESFFDLRKHLAKKGEAAVAKKKSEYEKEKAASAKALEHSNAFVAKAKNALAKDTPLPPRGTLITSIARQAGGVLLEQKKDAVLDDAVYFLEIASEGETRNHNESHSIRYNLACAFARQGKKDDAFAWLRKSLEVGVLLPWQQYGASFLHLEKKDPDMSSLRNDDRWDAIIKDFRNDNVRKFEKHKTEQEERQKREKERRKNGDAAPQDGDKEDGDEESDG